ncbi:MAG TPA: hypothetical protein VM487_26000, partial [Phycisphaerae bacterium]|nr:hypothetical protein [Phycisphaerae bacterium]
TTTIYIPGIWTMPEDVTVDAGGTSIRVPLQDARCRWGLGGLVKEYNVRHDWQPIPDPVSISDMFADVFFGMIGLTPGIDIETEGDFPEFAPEVRWEWATPAEALQELCDLGGLVIWPEVVSSVPADLEAGRFRIMPLSTVKALPGLEANYRAARSSSPPNLVPGKIIIVGDRTVNQITTQELEPVGEELDGTIKPLVELSYGPELLSAETILPGYTWGKELVGADFANIKQANPQEAELAKKCAFRWWRLTPPWDLTDPDLILSRIVDSAYDEEGNLRPRKPYLTGMWCEKKDGVYRNVFHSEDPNNHIPVEPTIDGFLVKLPEPLFFGMFDTGDPTFPHDVAEPGAFALTFAYELPPDPASYYQYVHNVAGGTTDDEKYVRVPGLCLQQIEGEDQNADDLDAIAEQLAEAEAATYESSTPEGYTYVGIYMINPDGATRRVQYRVGTADAGTDVEKNFERLVGGRLPLQTKKYLMELARARKDLPVP